MSRNDTSENKLIITDPSLEFDIFETARLRLVEAFVDGGHEPLEAEKIALYVVQGMRPMPKLLNVLTRSQGPTRGEIIEALGPVLDETIALNKARQMLLHIEQGSSE